MNILEVKNLSKQYRSFKLDNVTFSIEEGSITGFLGVNGAGKTTTIKSILGQIIPDSGEISLFGEVVNLKNETKLKNKIGIVYDDSPFYGHLTLKEMTSIVAPAFKKWDKKIYKETLHEFHLKDNTVINELSKGMKMKYSIALALSHHAKLLIMDEPTGGLDPIVRRDFSRILENLRENRITTLYSTHITSDLENIADHLMIINKGKIITNNTVKNLKAKENKDSTIEEILVNSIKEDNDANNVSG